MNRPLALVIVCALLATACGGDAVDVTPASAAGEASPQSQPAAIQVETATSAQSRGELEAPAVLELDETRTARLGAIVEAVVVDLRVNVGDRVSKGALLATLHSHVLHDAVAAYRKAEAERRQRETELKYATDAEARAKRLLAAKAISAQELARAETDRAAAAEALTIADSEVQRSLADLEHLGVDAADAKGTAEIERVPVRSPIAGVVIERLVAPGTAVTPGTALFVVSDLSQLWAIAEVDERQLSHLAPNQPATLQVAAYPDRSFDARVLAIADSLEERTRRVSVRVAVPNQDRRLKPHMFATVRLGLDGERTVVVVPKTALQTLGDRTVVFLQTDAGGFEPRPVVVFKEHGDKVELIDGLRAGERVATTGSFLLKSAQTPGVPE